MKSTFRYILEQIGVMFIGITVLLGAATILTFLVNLFKDNPSLLFVISECILALCGLIFLILFIHFIGYAVLCLLQQPFHYLQEKLFDLLGKIKKMIDERWDK